MATRARDYQPGEKVPGTIYEVVRLLGVGGMGTVYDVEDTSIGKRYVLKTLHPQLGDREDLARRMQNEARTLARLNHTNIVEVITAGVTGDDLRLPYYVMERLNGQSLRLVLEKKGQLELPHAYHIGIDLLDALDHAHDKGVIHRDVKPDNIFLHRTSAGVTVTKLLDFGILSLLDSTQTQRETAGRFLGTLRYAAPEQLRGEKPTAKVDVYAAALVLFEMIAGRGPFDDEGDPHKVAAAHLHKPAPPLSSFVVIPRELDALVSAALSKLPGQRPRDAFSFAASLRNLKKALAGAPTDNSTENRATAAALVGAESAAAPIVRVQQPAPDGPYVISPAAPGTPPGSMPVAAPYSTLRGMQVPSMGPSLAQPGPLGPTASSPPSVDRAAATHTQMPDVLPGPQHDTNAVLAGFDATLASNVVSGPPPIQPSAFRWPPEQPVARSEEPHVRSLSESPTVARSSIAPVFAAIALMGVLAVASLVLLVVRMRGPSPDAAAAKRPTVTTVTSATAPPAPQPVVVMPAPTIAPPALDDPSAPSAAPGASAPSAAPRATLRPTMPSAKPTAASSPALTPRPGPGF